MYNVYKEDLKEFTTCVAEDTKTVINQSTQIINHLAQDGSEDGNSNTNEIFKFTSKIKQELSNSLATFFSEYPVGSEQANEHEEALFIKDPQNIESFTNWCETFDLNTYTEEISQLLAIDAVVRDLHGRLGFFNNFYFYCQQMF